MRSILIILAALVLSLIASAIVWRDLGDPSLPLTPAPTLRQRQFGGQLTSTWLDILDHPIPSDIKADAPLETTLQSICDDAGIDLFINHRSLESAGVARDAKVGVSLPAGTKRGDAIIAILQR